MVDQGFEYKVITLLKGIYDNIGGGGVGYTSIQGYIIQPTLGDPSATFTEIYNDSPYTVEIVSTSLGVIFLSSNYTGDPVYTAPFIQQPSPDHILYAGIEDSGPPSCTFFIAAKNIVTGVTSQAGLLNGVNFEIRFYQEP